MSQSDVNLNERLRFMQFDDNARALLRELRPLLKRTIGDALGSFYDQVRATPETRRFFTDDKLVSSAKQRQETHWDSLASGDFSDTYAHAVRTVGKTHARIGLEPRWYIGGYAIVTDHLIKAIVSDKESNFFKRMTHNPDNLGAVLGVLVKAVLLDMDLAISTYLDALEENRRKAEDARAENLRQQAEALSSLTSSLSQISSGNLMARVDDDLAPEFDQMKRDFNLTAAKLQEVISAVVGSMTTIESGNRELAQASDDLARRTEQQAASLEETTAALAQITQGVKTTTDGVSHARQVAATATKDAELTSAVVSRSKVAMDEIQKATAKIGQITDVIDEIAFQTNLLALNAGVEAARAGDSGRGFAVVASEVRSLAQRASESAKDIKSLIDHATTSVAEGAALVTNTDDALGRFVSQVKEIGTIIAGIAETAQDQANGLSEVNIAVGDLDRATQQNAAMVEEATAATQSLAQEASKLAQELCFFNVGHVERAPNAPARRRETIKPAPVAQEKARRVANGRPQVSSQPESESWAEF